MIRFVKGIVEGVSQGLKTSPNFWGWRFKDLADTPYLYPVEYLENLRKNASSKEQLEMLRDYLIKHDVKEAPSFKSLLDRVSKDISPPKSEMEIIRELQEEIIELKRTLFQPGKELSIHDAIDFLKDFV